MSELSHSRFRAFRVAVSIALIVALIPIVGAADPPDAPGGINPKAPYSMAAAEGPVGLKGPVRTPEARRVAVEWRTGVPQAQIDAAAAQIGFEVVRRSEQLGWTLVEPTKRGMSGARLAEDLKSARLVTRATPENLYQAQATIPNDPSFGSLWGLDNTGQTGGTPDADIDAPEAWDEYGTGSSDVVVAVIDTGVNHAHPDLRPNRWVNTGEIPNNGVDDDENGWVDDYFGYDFYNWDNTPYDAYDGDQHGTHVAGTVGAKGDNGIGVAGVNWDVTIMPVKFLGPMGGWDVDGAEAIVYAVDNGADVINASWGGGWSDILEEAINYAADNGVLFVAAAGNWGEDVDAMPEWNYPASSQAPNVVTVAATDHNDELTWWSNYGSQTVEVAAPGENIVSTLPYETCALSINSPPYRISYLAMAPEAVEPASAGHALIGTAVQQVGASLSTPILVVDDSSPAMTGETEGERLDVYLDMLDGAGYTNVTTWSTENQGTPPFTALRNRVVVWFTGGTTWGWFYEPSVNAAERLVLGAYLDNGGRLVMASGELATDMVYFGEDWEWFETYFQATWVDYSAWGYDFSGVAGTPFAGISGTLRDEYQVWDTYPWPTGVDLVLPITSAAKPMVRIGGYGELSGTSMAAPHVTGSLAKLMQSYPDATPDEIVARLVNTTDPADSLESTTLFGGRINLYSAHQSYPGKPKVTAPKSGDILYGGTDYDIKWTPAEGGDPDATFEVEWAAPNEVASFDFEDADLSAFEMTSDLHWEITDASGDAYSGDRAVRSAPIAEEAYGYSSMATTLTAPPGGGTVSFWGRIESPEWDCWAMVRLNGMEVWYWDTALPWTHFSFPLRTGENRIEWFFETFQTPGGDNRFVVDDLAVLGWEYQPVGTAGAGETSLQWTVPYIDTDMARVRVRAALGPVYSAWDTVRDVRITTDTEAPGPPTSFEVMAGTDGDAHLTWVDPGDADFALTRIVRSSEGPPSGPNDESAEVVYEGTDGMHREYGLADGTTYYYAAFSRDEMHNWSDGAWDSITAVDETPPEAPSMLDAFMWEGTVAATWVPPTPETYAGVLLLRRTDAPPTGWDDPLATVVFDGPGAWAADWMLTEEPVETQAYYGAWSYDASGNWSDGAFADLWVDTIGPEGTFVLNNDDEHTPTPDVTGYADVTDTVEMRYAVNGGSPPLPTARASPPPSPSRKPAIRAGPVSSTW
jgi:subtilisin family serine protease